MGQSINFHRQSNSIEFNFLFQRLKIPSAAYFQLHDFKFDDIYMDDDDTLKVIAFLFTIFQRSPSRQSLSNAHFPLLLLLLLRLSSRELQFQIQFISCFFLFCNLIGMLANVPGAGLRWTFSYWLWSSVPMAIKRQKELSKCYLSQLAACFQCGTNDVLNCYGKYMHLTTNGNLNWS